MDIEFSLNRIDECIRILEALRTFTVEHAAKHDADETLMQNLLDGFSDIANQRIEAKDDTPLMLYHFKQPDAVITVSFDVTVKFPDSAESDSTVA